MAQDWHVESFGSTCQFQINDWVCVTKTWAPYIHTKVNQELRNLVVEFGPPGRKLKWFFQSTHPQPAGPNLSIDFYFRYKGDAILFGLKYL